ncbi:hypothetical protein V9K92_10285 [Phyllobacterium sp. CCNWLW109]|uniref:hypothetical protein n=1 Tax=Phyllobacterium sp. CCNWLW109 TaxID=3127479 RepID=UPI003076C161
MTALANQKPLWSRAEKDFVEQLYFEKWSPSGIAARVHEKFGTDRTRQQVSDLNRNLKPLTLTSWISLRLRGFQSWRKYNG